jgi:hypothetical protein
VAFALMPSFSERLKKTAPEKCHEQTKYLQARKPRIAVRYSKNDTTDEK